MIHYISEGKGRGGKGRETVKKYVQLKDTASLFFLCTKIHRCSVRNKIYCVASHQEEKDLAQTPSFLS